MTSSAMSMVGSIAAASQSTVFVTMVDDGTGSDSGNTTVGGGALTGRLFGLELMSAAYTVSTFGVRGVGTASGQSFFRQLRIINDGGSVVATLTSAAATYNSGSNSWTWNQVVAPGSYTLQFFR